MIVAASVAVIPCRRSSSHRAGLAAIWTADISSSAILVPHPPDRLVQKRLPPAQAVRSDPGRSFHDLGHERGGGQGLLGHVVRLLSQGQPFVKFGAGEGAEKR